MRILLFLALGFLLAPAVACKLPPLNVQVDGAGLSKMGVAGEKGHRGKTKRDLRYGKEVLPSGTDVVVLETWLLREGGGGYRIPGLFDPNRGGGGVILPRGSVLTYYLCAAENALQARLPIPQKVLELKTKPQ